VFLSSHIAGGSKNMQERAAEEVVKAVAAHFKDQPVSTISMSRLETMT
jgi:phosphoglycerate dehydrogenase-like enzyme